MDNGLTDAVEDDLRDLVRLLLNLFELGSDGADFVGCHAGGTVIKFLPVSLVLANFD